MNINWEAAANYSEDSFRYAVFKNDLGETQGFCDDEVNDHTDFINEVLEAWVPLLQDPRWVKSNKIDTSDLLDDEHQDRKLEMWESAVGRVMTMDDPAGSFVLVVTEDDYLVVGNHYSHPFVETRRFCFDNSDGSTSHYDVTNYTPSNLEKLVTDARDFLFDQSH